MKVVCEGCEGGRVVCRVNCGLKGEGEYESLEPLKKRDSMLII